MSNNVIDLDSLVLKVGSHDDWEHGACLLEAASYMAGEEWTDSPECVCPVLATFGRSWNDSVDHAFRQRLKPFIPRLLNTANDGHAETRAWLCVDWLVRVQAPAWLRLIAKHDLADTLEKLPAVLSSEAARAIQPTLDRARKESVAGRAAAWDAARDAAGAAAWDAAGAAAWAAAGDAAGAAAWDAAGAAAWDASWDAARDAAWDASWAAAWAAAGAAAQDALRPTVETLQESALGLFDAMLKLGESQRVIEQGGAPKP